MVAGQSLLREPQLRYQGTFDIPEIGHWQDPPGQRLDYSMGTICYREDCDALYVVTHSQDPTGVSLIQVPESIHVSDFNLAKQIAAPKRLPSIPDQQVRLRGLYWDQPSQTLFYNYNVWYNVSGSDSAGFGAMRADRHFGLWYVAHNNASAGYIAREPIAGQLLMGNAVAQGIATSSLGPSVLQLQWDEDNLPAPMTRVPVKTLLHHRLDSPTPNNSKRASASSGKPWLDGMEVAGGVCIDGTLVIAVDEGERSFYGTPEEFHERFGLVPRSGGKGYHNDPHRAMLWLYDCDALISSQGSHSIPYAYVRIAELPENGWLGGLAYDSRHRRLFVSQSRGNTAMTPRIYVYEVAPAGRD
jgi:hypothetical protein